MSVHWVGVESSEDFEGFNGSRWKLVTGVKGGAHLDDCFRSNARREVSEAKERLELRRPVASIFSACAPGMYLNLRSIAERVAARSCEDGHDFEEVLGRLVLVRTDGCARQCGTTLEKWVDRGGRRRRPAKVARRARKNLRGWA